MTGQWQPIETAPKDQTIVDLWIVGDPDAISFYCPTHRRHKDKISREGRLSDAWWYDGAWRPRSGITKIMPVDAEVTHWMPLPEPPT